jgi:hypothetical protein
MSKKLILSLLVVGLLLLSVPMALAANDKLQNPGCASGGSGLSNAGGCGGLGCPGNGATPQSNSNL